MKYLLLALAAAGSGALLLWNGMNQPYHSSLGLEARLEVFPRGDLDIGRIPAGTQHNVNVILRNPTTERVFLFDLQKSCGCINSSFIGGYLEPLEQKEIQVTIAPKQASGSFRERLWLLASSKELDGVGFEITGSTWKAITIMEEPNFGELHSEMGGSANFFVTFEPMPGLEETLAFKIDDLFEIISRPYQEIFSVTLDSIDIGPTSSGGAFMKGALRAKPSSFWGPIRSSQLLLKLPGELGGGQYRIPIQGGFLPDVVVDEGPLFDTGTWMSGSERVFQIYFRPGRITKAEITFLDTHGSDDDFNWSVEDNDDGWVLKLKPIRPSGPFPQRELSLPYRTAAGVREVRLGFK